MSSTEIAPFQRWVGQTSNLDRCTRCGRPRSVHGADWSCPHGGVSLRGALAVLIAGCVLSLGGIALRLASAVNHQIPAAIFLAGVVLAVGALSVLGRDG